MVLPTKIFSPILFLFFPIFSLSAEEPLILEHADSLRTYLGRDSMITYLKGDVQFQQGTITLRSNEATWFKDQGMALFEGGVKLTDGKTTVWTDKATYYKDEQRALAEGRVRAWDEENQTRLTCGRMGYWRREERILATDNPILEAVEEEARTTVWADSIELFSRENKVEAKGNVILRRGDLQARSGYGFFLFGEGRILLRKSPIITQKGKKLTGERMEIRVEDHLPKEVFVWEDAKGEYEDRDERGRVSEWGWVTGKKMSIAIIEEELEAIKVEGNSVSFYSSSSDSGLGGENRSSSDSCAVDFSGGRANRVRMWGGVEGIYLSPSQEGRVDTVGYSAQSISYSQGKIVLGGGAQMEYAAYRLESDSVRYDLNSKILEAEGRPVFWDGNQELRGVRMVYNLETGRGRVRYGESSYEQGIYRGEEIREVNPEVILVEGGRFTTCDHDTPHYYFWSQKMKILPKDKVIARPLLLYIADLPVAAIPFCIFPIKPGRHSGLLTLDLGFLDVSQRFVRNLGYYFAPSPYWDAMVSLDYYEKTGLLLKGETRYALRYRLEGNVGGSWKREREWVGSELKHQQRWDLKFSHYQHLSPTWKLTANGLFVSDKSYYSDIGFHPQERMNRSLHSHLTLSKRWETSSLNIGLDRYQNLDLDQITQSLPSVRYSHPSSPIFKGEEGEKGWYQNIYLSFSSYLLNYSHKVKDTKEDHSGLDNHLSITGPQKLRWLTISPSFNLRHTWWDKDKEGESLVHNTTYDLSLRANTTIYGTFLPHWGRITGFRHILKPSLSYSWKPKFKDQDRFYSFGGIGPSGGEREVLGIGLNNIFQLKWGREKPKKVELATLNLSTSYDFKALKRKWGYLSSNLRVRPFRGLGLNLASTYDLYSPQDELTRPHLVSLSLTTDLSLSGWEGKEERRRPWRFSISHHIYQMKGGATETNWLSGDFSLNLTPNWRLDYQARYDFVDKRLTSQSFKFHRDLHCWEASFYWIPTGFKKGYYFRVNIKAIPEIKVEKGKGIRGIF